MSMKIYDAYRVTVTDPWPVLWSIRRTAEAHAAKRLDEVCSDIVSGRAEAKAAWCDARDRDYVDWCREDGRDWLFAAVDYPCVPRIGAPPSSRVAVTTAEVMRGQAGPATTSAARDWLVAKYKAQAGSHERNLFDLDVSVTVHEDAGRLYFLPMCDHVSLMAGTLDFMAGVDGLASYAYWNNADGPEDVSDDEWRQRGEVWRRLLGNGRNLTMHIVTPATIWRLMPGMFRGDGA